MDQQKVDMYIVSNSEKFPEEKIQFLRQTLLEADDSKWMPLSCLQLKSPFTALILSIFCGTLGIDRFYLGQTGLGVAKLLTCGGLGIWAIVDLFLIMNATRDINFEKLQRFM